MSEVVPMKPIDKFTGEYAFLSNFYPSNIEMDGLVYPTLEHAFQAAKTLNGAERLLIHMQPKPGQAKQAGRRVQMRKDWPEIKIGIMGELIAKKFGSGSDELAQRLLATGNRQLIEGNTWNDTFWGSCRGKGTNWLGVLLMRQREALRGGR